jgi:predicted amidohydrolase
MPTLRVALVQLEARDDVDDNLRRAAALADEAARDADLVILPEYVQYRGSADGYRASARPVPGPTTEPFAAIAAARGCWVLAGSHAEASDDPARPFNTAVLFDRSGALAARYRKLHLFDVAVDDGPADTESARVMPGDRAVVAAVDGAGVGLTICYDLRFPELYRALALAGASVLAVPAVFTERTGRDHWEVLLRARAIENGAWVVAAAGCGRGGPGAIPAWGHSMVVDPWGRVVASAGDGEAIVRADLDLDAAAAAKRQIPVLANRRPEALPPLREVDVAVPAVVGQPGPRAES